MLDKLKKEIKSLKRHGLTIYFIARDSHTRWLLRLFAAFVAAYAFSPIDLIPDFIPILGLLDDLVLVAGAYLIILKFTPLSVRFSAEQKADQYMERPVSLAGALFVVTMWLVLLVLALVYFGVLP